MKETTTFRPLVPCPLCGQTKRVCCDSVIGEDHQSRCGRAPHLAVPKAEPAARRRAA